MHSFAVLAAVTFALPAYAFTNGSIVPPYICNPVSDGLPKSFGQLLLYTSEQVNTVAFNSNKGQDINGAPQTNKQDISPSPNAVGNTAYILASFHDSPNNIQSINQSIQVMTNTGKSTIVAGQANQLNLQANAQLKGVLAYARDASNTPQGTFKDNGGQQTFVQFPGCGMNPQGQVNGVIQQKGVSASNTYNNLIYNAPACIPSNTLTIAGLSVTGAGFGTWKYTFAVTGSTCSNSTTSAANGTAAAGTTGTKANSISSAGNVTAAKGKTNTKGHRFARFFFA